MLLKAIFYDWILPNEQAFLKTFKDNDAKLNAAKQFLNSLSNCELLLFLICVFVTIMACVSYYTWYNRLVKPFGYHYRRRHWAAWLAITLVVTFCVAKFACIPLLKNVGLEGTDDFILRLYIGNAVYALVIFLFASIVWCNFLPTNAYRWFNCLNFKR